MVCVSQCLFRQLLFWNFLLSPWLELGPSSLCQAHPLNSWVGARPWVTPTPELCLPLMPSAKEMKGCLTESCRNQDEPLL